MGKEQSEFIKKIYSEMYYSLSAYARSTLKDHSLAEEAVQDTFRIACGKVDEFMSSPNPKGWLTNTLKNIIRNTIRSRAKLNNFVVSLIAFDENTDGTTKDEISLDLLYSDLVASEDFTLLKKIVLDRYSMLDAAKELGISLEACKKRVQRAKFNLKNLIQNNL